MTTQQWQPIETAPRDGTQIVAVDCDGQRMVAEYSVLSDGTSVWEIGHSSDGYILHCGAPLTHWMPLPEPPK